MRHLFGCFDRVGQKQFISLLQMRCSDSVSSLQKGLANSWPDPLMLTGINAMEPPETL